MKKSTFISILIEVGFAAIAAPIASAILELNVQQGLVFGILVFLAVAQIGLKDRIESIMQRTARVSADSQRLRSIENTLASLADEETGRRALEAELASIATTLESLKRLPSGEVFHTYYSERLTDLYSSMVSSLDSNSLTIDVQALREQDRLFKVFRGRATDYFWATVPTAGVKWFLTAKGNFAIRQIHECVADNRVTEVRRLFIVESRAQLNEDLLRLCISLHRASGYAVRAIEARDFHDFFSGFATSDMVTDFGLYGKHFVWETTLSPNGLIERGVVSSGPSRIARYEELYGRLWYMAEEPTVSFEGIGGQGLNDFRRLAYDLGLVREEEIVRYNEEGQN